MRVAGDYELSMDDAHVGSVYNFGISFSNAGTRPLTVLSARMIETPSVFSAVAPLLGQNCGSEVPLVSVGDLKKNVVKVDLTELSARPVPNTGGRTCYYVLYRYVPTRQGDFTAKHGEIIYKVGGHTHRATFDVAVTLHVNATGPDPRDVYDPLR